MAELFQTSIPNVSVHIRNNFNENELHSDSVVKEFLTTAADGKKYQTRFYNLDVIISVSWIPYGNQRGRVFGDHMLNRSDVLSCCSTVFSH